MGFAFRMMIFMIGFNLAVGITILALGQSAWLLGPGAERTGQEGLNQIVSLNSTMGGVTGVPVEETSFWYRFLDIISLGFFNKIQNFLNTTIYSIPTMLVSMGMPGELATYMRAGIFLIVVIGMIELFTGKDLTTR